MENKESIKFDWERIDNLPTKKNASCSVVYGDKIYVFGGSYEEEMCEEEGTMICLNSMCVLDTTIKNGKWEDVACNSKEMPPPRMDCASGLYKNKMIVCCGYNEFKKGFYLNDLWSFDLDKREWEKLDDAPYSATAIRGFVDGNCFYIHGGYNNSIKKNNSEKLTNMISFLKNGVKFVYLNVKMI
eukprot:TRINITY_DN14657_c0_g1_i1.p1 TRINITY_DN14657_c0_g1~~TRINITY_DN14657_c0_g1_i1.p1  ORF type:complete len:185 (+),score=49.46 TRINITY_DN14657_c0_g1_i1:38-592(+)